MSEATQTINDKLIAIQSNLKAPKSQRNDFGKYNYRNCEDILEAAKPLLMEQGLHLTLSDDVSLIGDRFYIKATATISNGKETLSVSAFAREELTKKGMDASQITGAASSYARKYALNGLFCIDDTKDADSANNAPQNAPENRPAQQRPQMVQQQQAPSAAPVAGDIAEQLQAAQDMKTLVGIFNALDNDQKREFKSTFDAMRSSLAAA